MSQKQAISQTPIDLKPEDEARLKAAKSGAISPEATPNPPSGEAQPAPNRDQQPKPGRPQAPRRIQDGDNTVQISSSNQPARPVPQKRPPAPTRSHVPANDDMPSIGGLIYAMQQRPSRSPFLIALIASAIWFALGLLVSWAVFQKTVDASGSTADLFGQSRHRSRYCDSRYSDSSLLVSGDPCLARPRTASHVLGHDRGRRPPC